jgi:RHS repeat-associated protein
MNQYFKSISLGAIAALVSFADAAGTKSDTWVPTDAFKEAWTPPAPVRTRTIQAPDRGHRVSKPDVALRFGASPTANDLENARALGYPLRMVGSQSLSEAHCADTIGLLKNLQLNGGRKNTANCAKITEFLEANPDSPFSVSLLLERAATEWKHGYFMDALDSYRDAWSRGKNHSDLEEKRLAEIAYGKLVRHLAQLGRKDELKSLIAEGESRELGGFAQESLSKAKETLWFFENQPEQNVFCGFTATNTVCVPFGHRPIFPDVHDEDEAREFIENGLSLYELKAHSHEAGGNVQLWKRGDTDELPVPSVIHWNFNHYSAITERDGDLYRVKDEHMKVDTWVPLDAINQQGSGYFAAEASVAIPATYVAVQDDEAKTVFGRHCVHGRDDEGDDCPEGGDEDDCAMATYSFRLLNPGLELHDTPIRYTPPFGPEVSFKLNYDQRSSTIADLQDHGNFGPRWTYDFLSFIDLVGSGTPSAQVEVVFGNGTFYRYNYNTQAGTYSTAYGDRPRLDYISSGANSPGYQLTYKDGSVRLYTQGDTASPSRYYLTQIADPQGNALSLQYDTLLRLTGLIDALGQLTTISYTPDAGANVPTDTKKIRSITDPFNRTANFKYTTSGQLFQIIDAEGIVSEFAYIAGDFVNQLITPYGTTTFEWGDLPGINSEPGRYIEATDPYGDKERVEANDLAFGSLSSYDYIDTYELRGPSSVDVDGQSISFLPKNDNLHFRNSYYWDKQQMKYHAGDHTKATIYNWLAVSNEITGVLGSIKYPEEARIWYNYPGQTSSHAPGTLKSPSKTVKAVEDENGVQSWSMTQNEYEPNYGKVSKTIDPLGREMVYEYNPNSTVAGAITGIDLTALKVKNGASYETIVSYSNFVNSLPQTVTEASGTVTSHLYNSKGQITQTTVTKGSDSETTKFIYDLDLDGTPDAHGYLVEVQRTDPTNPTGFITLMSYEYDNAGRIREETDTEGYTRIFDYDNFDRITLITHPDNTTEQFVYSNLDLEAQKDRNGNWTRFRYDAYRRPVIRQDANGDLTQFEWCRCGDIRKIIDANFNVTHWKRDAQGRVTEKVFPDGTKNSYNYQPYSGLLDAVTYANDQASGQPTMRYRYFIDGSMQSVDYTDVNTPDVSYEYNDPLARLTAHIDQLGTTGYSYLPFTGTQNGAGELYEINGPWADDTARMAYDWQSRLTTRQILDDTSPTANVLHSVVRDFDSLGRLESEVNNLGTFTFEYSTGNSSPKVDALLYPNGMRADYDYYAVTGSANDARLKEIHNTANGGATISKFSYQYDPSGRIEQWTQQQGATAASLRDYSFVYDKTSQLTDAVIKDNGGTTLKTWSWQYDAAGNRVRESEDVNSIYTQHNGLNQLNQIGGSGKTLVEGVVDEPAFVKVNGQDAIVLSQPGGDFLFRKEIAVSEGSNTITVEATDASGNSASNAYSVVVGGVQKTLEYDLNGNLRYEKDTSGTVLREFQWDAINRLVKIIDGTDVSEFEYDALDRRVRIVEKENAVVQSDETYLWGDGEILQRRASNGQTVQRSYFADGFEEGSSDYFVTRDHLGSVREVIASNGTTVESAYEYTPWGEVSQTGGTGVASDFLYTGHYYHEVSELHFTLYRAYNPEFGCWLSRDPLENNWGLLAEFLPEGPNLYGYVGNNPVSYIDYEGEAALNAIGAGIGAGISFGTQFGANGGFGAIWNGDWDKAWQATKCVDYADVALSAGSGALGLGAVGNIKKAHGALKQARRVRNMYSRYSPSGGAGPTGYVGDAVNQGVKAGAKGAAGFGLNSLKDDLDYTPGDCD